MADDGMANDERFKHITKDPRFKKLPKQEKKIKIDKRFKTMFEDKKFKVKFSVDKRGRPVKLSSKENLKNYYEVSSSDDEESVDEDDDEGNAQRKKISKKSKNANVKEKAVPTVESSSGDSDSEEEDGIVDLARGEGVMSSSSDDDSSSDKESEDEGFDHGWGELDADTERRDEVSRRFAACNMDWDRIKALDLLVLFNSFKPSGGIIKSVKIYPSEYGKERMQEEDMKGPKELIESHSEEPNDCDGKEGSHYHMEKLRKYQLSRLKYYYAVIECDDKNTANHIYEECDGLEYEASSTRLDLRFIPDDMEFEAEPHSMADSLPDIGTYEPSQFVTTALQQAKVSLTWDETNPDRTKAIQKAFDDEDTAENDLKAYLASSSGEESSSHSDLEDDAEVEHLDSISKYKALINDIDDKERKKKDEDIEMEVTWEPGLKDTTEKDLKIKAKEGKLTPWEKYLEKKKKKLEEKKAKKSQQEVAEDEQPFSDDDIPSDVDMNDPYFAEEFQNAAQKPSKKKKKEPKNGVDSDNEKSKAELELLMMDDDHEKKHFNMKGIIEEETKTKKKNKKKKRKAVDEPADNQDDFEVDVKDSRFTALYTSHHFNIDPSDQHFKKTKGMEAIVTEKQKRHRNNDKEEQKTMTQSSSRQDDNLSMLIKSVKNKTAANYKKIKRK